MNDPQAEGHMASHIGRRKFLAALGGAAAWPLAARAQQAMPVVGFLHTSTAAPFLDMVSAFRKGLNEAGFIEGQNVAIEYRWAEFQYDLPALAADLVARRVTVISVFGPPAALAAKAATVTIPIVFSVGVDPVDTGLVASLNRPGGNLTGMTLLTSSLGAKRVGLLRELIPKADLIALLVNPNSPDSEPQVADVQVAAREVGQRVMVLNATTDADIDAAFATLSRQRIGGLMVGGDQFLDTRRDRIVALAARHSMPTIYHRRDFVAGGGLMSYGTSIVEVWRQVGVYTGRILKGEKPADLPVMRPTKFELVINLKAANALGLTIPPGVLAIGDEVIE
jgi:putative tryptophan/tyrosine transport system substrate-binding protein